MPVTCLAARPGLSLSIMLGFPGARVEVFHNEFVFPEAEPALRYWRSMRDDPELEAAMRNRIEAIIERREIFAFRSCRVALWLPCRP